MAEDFKRLLAALPPDKRKVIGQDLMGLIDGDEVEKINDAPFNLEEKALEIEEIERLQCELQAQEEQIKDLKTQIARMEAEGLDPAEDQGDFVEELRVFVFFFPFSPFRMAKDHCRSRSLSLTLKLSSQERRRQH